MISHMGLVFETLNQYVKQADQVNYIENQGDFSRAASA